MHGSNINNTLLALKNDFLTGALQIKSLLYATTSRTAVVGIIYTYKSSVPEVVEYRLLS